MIIKFPTTPWIIPKSISLSTTGYGDFIIHVSIVDDVNEIAVFQDIFRKQQPLSQVLIKSEEGLFIEALDGYIKNISVNIDYMDIITIDLEIYFKEMKES